MTNEASYFDVHKQLPDGTSMILGFLAISHTKTGKIIEQQFMYEAEYTSHPLAAEISPLMGLDKQGMQRFPSDGSSFVGFIDDLLPDDWGKRLIARHINKRFITNLTSLNYIGTGSSIGACKITMDGEVPNWDEGLCLDKADKIIESLNSGDIEALSREELEYVALVRGGSAIGGARPKMLVKDLEGNACMIKPNQVTDNHDVVTLEWASLEICRMAGLRAAESSIYTLNGKIKSLLIKRFDTTPEKGRRQLATINSLLKDPHTQCDAMNYSYEDIAGCIKKFCWDVKTDLMQLFGAMLINQALGNTDDHLRNFSLLSSDKGWELSPIYDVLPHFPLHAEHASRFNNSGYLPKLSSAIDTGKALGLSRADAVLVSARVVEALSNWQELLVKEGVDDPDLLNVPEATQGLAHPLC